MNSKESLAGKAINSFQFKLLCQKEEDGKLGTIESQIIPGFDIERIIYVFDVPKGAERANHACMNAAIIFIAISGSVNLSIECNCEIKNYTLDDKSLAVYAPPAAWIRAYEFSNDAVLLGLSDKHYRDSVYVDDYKRYKTMIGENKA